MAAKNQLQYLWGSALQSGADAFVQAAIATALNNVSGIAYSIKEIMFELPNLINASGSRECSLTRKSMAAMPLITEKSLITKFKQGEAFTTSGSIINDVIVRQTFDSPDQELLIVEDPIYFQFDTAAVGTNTGYVRIGYVQQKISDLDRVSLIAASLA